MIKVHMPGTNSAVSPQKNEFYAEMWRKLHHQKYRITFILILALFSYSYASLAPSIFSQDWDSLMYAYWAEVNGVQAIWGNHPLSHVVLNSIYLLLQEVGYQGKTLPVYILVNSIFGGAAVGVFFLFLTRIIRIDYLKSLAYAVIFGASYGLWHYSGSADVYSLSVLLLLLSWSCLISEVLIRNHRFAYFSGVLAGLSVLSHQLNAVFFLVALVVIFSQKKDRWTRIYSFFGTAISVFFAGSLLFGYIATSSFAISEIYPWLRGYLGNPIYGTYLKLESIPVAVNTALRTVLFETYGKTRFLRIAIYSVVTVSGLFGITQIKLLNRKNQIILFSAIFHCLVSWVLIIWFEPFYIKFWLLTLAPSLMILALCIEAFSERLDIWFAELKVFKKYFPQLLVLVSLFVVGFNLRAAFLPEHNPDQLSQDAINLWLQYSDPNDMLITAGDLIPQLQFWENRPHTVHLYDYLEIDINSDDRFRNLREKIDQHLCSGEAVIFAPAILDNFLENFLLWLDIPREDLRSFFDDYSKEQFFTYITQEGIETQVYRLISSKSCDY